MADLSDLQAAISSKIVGSDATGLETNAVGADINGNLQVVDYADGPVSPGAVAARSSLAGAQFNSVLPTLTNTQQASLQVDSRGRLIVTDISVVVDKATYTYGTNTFQPVGGVFQDTSPTLTAGQSGSVRLTAERALHTNLRNAAGAEIGTLASPLYTNTAFNVLGGQLVPTITNKFRVRYSRTPASVVSAYTTVYTRSGTGLFFGFQLDFNSANCRVRFTVDGGQVFEVTVDDIKAFQFNDTSTGRMQMGGFWTTVGNTLDFSLKYAIPYTTSVLVEVQRSDSTNHTLNEYMVFLTEDT